MGISCHQAFPGVKIKNLYTLACFTAFGGKKVEHGQRDAGYSKE
jgi:hypothetical protein